MSFPFIISETNGLRRAIVLRNRSLPYQGVAWGGEQTIDLNWFPGNPVGVVQIIGPRWKAMTVTGKWKDTMLVDESSQAELINFPAIASVATAVGAGAEFGGSTFVGGNAIPLQRASRARVLRDAFTLLRKSGALLRIEWGSLVRYGVLTSDNYPHDREEDIDWEFEFTVTGDTANQPKPLAQAPENALSLLKKILAALNKVLDLLLQAVFVQQKWRQRVFGPVQQITSLVLGIVESLDLIAGQALTTANSIPLIRSNLQAIVASTFELVKLIDDAQNAGTEATEAALNPVGSDLSFLFQSQIRAELVRLAAEAAAASQRLPSPETTEIKSIYVSPGGVTLRDISREAYGTPVRWRKIAEFNSLPFSTVPRGTVVLIPNQ